MSTPRDASLCVFCRRNTMSQEWRPFCSERCKLQDLARWVDERYRIPAASGTESDHSEKEEGEP